MTNRKLPMASLLVVTTIALSLAILSNRTSWAQGLTSPRNPAPPEAPAASSAHPTDSVLVPAVAPAAKPTTLPPEVIKALIAPVMAPTALAMPTPTKTAQAKDMMAEAAADKSAVDKTATDLAEATNNAAALQASEQLDKFQKVFEQATKIFGSEHTVITPSFFYATDRYGRLNPTDKHLAGISAVLLLPLFGLGGGHGSDWWPVVASGDETQIYNAFLNQLGQYQEALTNATTLPSNVSDVLQKKWDTQNLLFAKQVFCQEEMDPDLPPEAQAAIKNLCQSSISDFVKKAADQKKADPKTDLKKLVSDAVTTNKDAIAPKRHNLLIGPSFGVPLTKSPIDIFQLGASAELGGDAVRIVATGGLVGRYQGATYKDVFAAGWFVGLALSGEIGDKLFHYFNGGSNLMAQLAQIKSSQP